MVLDISGRRLDGCAARVLVGYLSLCGVSVHSAF